MSLEQSIRKYTEEPTKSVIRPELGFSLDSLGEASDFYNFILERLALGIGRAG